MRSAEQFNEARRLMDDGENDCSISRRLGIPRPTVRDWRVRAQKRSRLNAAFACGTAHEFLRLPPSPYAYLLGLYLGDGCISRDRRTWRLRIVLDSKYPAVIERCRLAIDALMPDQAAAVQVLPKNCVEVGLYSKHWPCLFPQHGPGKKHSRRIALEPWQQALRDKASEEFVLGLIHSDGCRVVANDRGVASVRYHFSNRSSDILDLFTGALDGLAIPWTRSSAHVVSVYRKAATARLDEFVGPKTRAVPLTCVHYAA